MGQGVVCEVPGGGEFPSILDHRLALNLRCKDRVRTCIEGNQEGREDCLAHKVFKVVLQKSSPTRTRQLTLYIMQ
jgi:hypothetical protein